MIVIRSGLGSVWTDKSKWAQFKSWLREQNEGEDDCGMPLSLDRYALFLELYIAFDSNFRSDLKGENVMLSFMNIVNHEEKFFGNYRCLKCLDSGDRKLIIKSVKQVKNGTLEPNPTVFEIVYQKVFDKLLNLLGGFQNKVILSLSDSKSLKNNKSVL